MKDQLIGQSPETKKLCRALSKVVNSTHPVLILGESGTGKELVARLIHVNGQNAAEPFIPVDCGALVPTLVESELFGYVAGAFTGANKAKEGLLSAANGGTIFFDEIGELPLDLQAKLLRVLQEKEVRPVGATHAVPITARVLAATNRNLLTMVKQGRFREDLYFRLNVVSIRIPALRERRADIAVLAEHFLEQVNQNSKDAHTFSDQVLRIMTSYDWPGNVRELENAIDRACALSSGPVLHLDDLPTQLQEFCLQSDISPQPITSPLAAEKLRIVPVVAPTSMAEQNNRPAEIVSIAELEKRAILVTSKQLKGDKLMAAKLLGIGKTTLYRKLRKYCMVEDSKLEI